MKKASKAPFAFGSLPVELQLHILSFYVTGYYDVSQKGFPYIHDVNMKHVFRGRRVCKQFNQLLQSYTREYASDALDYIPPIPKWKPKSLTRIQARNLVAELYSFPHP